jgi:putative membrane protein
LPFKVQASPVTAQSQFFTAFSSAAAHEGAEISGLTAPGPAGLAPVAWSGAELAVILPLGLSLALYLIGLARLWHRAGFGRGIRMIHVAAFAAGWLTLAVALVSPLHGLGETLFTAHMIQHVLLVGIAAPLLVLGRPGAALSWSLPKAWRPGLGVIVRAGPVAAGWKMATNPLVATVLHGGTIWAWHVPLLFEAALDNEWLHWLEHATFLATAVLFWWALIGRPARALGYGVSLACLFVTLLHTSLLGTLLTLSPQLWYAPAAGAAEWGLTALEDQQLAGLIMWIPGAALYTLAALVLAAVWITDSARQHVRQHVAPPASSLAQTRVSRAGR